MTFLYRFGRGSGSSDPYIWLTDPNADPGGPTTSGSGCGFGTLVHLHHSSKIKSHTLKKLQNSRNQGFSYYFCLMMEGSGSVLVANGSGCGSGRPKTYGSYGFGSGSATPGSPSGSATLMRTGSEIPRYFWHTRNIQPAEIPVGTITRRVCGVLRSLNSSDSENAGGEEAADQARTEHGRRRSKVTSSLSTGCRLPPPLRVVTAGRNHLNEEMTPPP